MKLEFKIGDLVFPTDDRVEEGYYSHGYSYEILDIDENCGNILLEDDDGDQEWLETYQFMVKCLEDHSDIFTSEHLVGKVVTFNRKKYTIDDWSRLTSANITKDTTKAISDIVEEFGFCFCVSAGKVVMPTSKVKVIDNRVVLNGQYTVLISKDVINVGCQEIPYQKVLDIVTGHKALYGN